MQNSTFNGPFNSNWTIHLNVKTKTIKFIDENIGGKEILCDFGLGTLRSYTENTTGKLT